ncbi:MAG: hypothetical protein ABW194_02145, partial [Novosphingobium sp.]
AIGAAAGTLNEVLTKHGVSEEDASYYGERLKTGGVFVCVDDAAGVDQSALQQILYRNGGHNTAQPRTAAVA